MSRLAEILVAAGVGAPAGAAAAWVVRAYWPTLKRLAAVALAATVMEAFAWAALVVDGTVPLLASGVLGWTLVCLAAVDVACFRLPDRLTLPLVLAGLALSFALPERPVAAHLLGAVIGYVALAGLAWLYERVRGRAGMGLGDAKLLAAAGAWLGAAALPEVVLIACALAFFWVAVRWTLGERDIGRMRVAFGAPLCLSIWLVWLYAPGLDGGGFG